MSDPFPLDDWGGTGPVLHLAHANGFPPGTYRQLIQALTPRAHVFTARSRSVVPDTEPRSLRSWEDLAEDLAASLRARGLQDVVGVGHSMGGVATLLASLKYPGLFRSVVMLDPVIFTGGRLVLIQLLGLFGQQGRIPPARMALRRRNHWGSREEAGESYRKKALFRNFHPDALRDYLTHGLTEAPGGGFRLTIPREWEARIFSTTVSGLWRRMRAVTVPTLVLRGADSDTLTAPALARVRSTLPGARTEEVPGGHLFPLEHPEACARRILAFLDAPGAAVTGP